jgi:hypothetical protein
MYIAKYAMPRSFPVMGSVLTDSAETFFAVTASDNDATVVKVGDDVATFVVGVVAAVVVGEATVVNVTVVVVGAAVVVVVGAVVVVVVGAAVVVGEATVVDVVEVGATVVVGDETGDIFDDIVTNAPAPFVHKT